MESQYLKNIKIGLRVEILTDNYKISKGIVRNILTQEPYHIYGIKVKLHNNEIGRVQKIILSDKEIREKILNEIKRMLDNGENFYTEFKSECLWSVNFTKEDIKKSRSFDVHYFKQKASKVIIAKSITAFLNSEGGNLIIGIKEDKEKNNKFIIAGVEKEYKKLRDSTSDGYKRMIIDEIIKPYFPSFIFNHLKEYIIIELININDKTICLIRIRKSDRKVFLKINNKEYFLIRVDSENRLLDGEKLVDYCIRHWKN